MREIIYSTNFEESPARTKFSMVVPYYGDEVREVVIRDARHYPHYFLDGARHDLKPDEVRFIKRTLAEVDQMARKRRAR